MRKNRALVGKVFCLGLAAAVGAAEAATISVTRVSTRANDGGCSFEEAVAALNAGRGSSECPYSGPGAMRITIPTGTFNTGLGVQIRRSVTIAGGGREATSLQFATTTSAGAMGMTIAPYLAVTFQDLSLRGSTYAQGLNNNGATLTLLRTRVADFGFGGMVNSGTLNLGRLGSNSYPDVSAGCVIENNGLAGGNGGIVNYGFLNVYGTAISGNYSYSGGGITHLPNVSGMSLSIRNSALTYNSAYADGGGIYSQGEMEMKNSTLSGNVSQIGSGGGVYFDARYSSSGGEFQVLQCTIARNSASSSGWGGGAFVLGASNMTINGSIFASNYADPAYPEFYTDANFASTFYDIVQAPGNLPVTLFPAYNGNYLGQDPGLGSLQYAGGSTMVHPLSIYSFAYNRIPLGGIVSEPFDQRGSAYPRPRNGSLDIGSYELQ